MEQEQIQRQKSIFRKESLDRAASPEQLNDYIRVYNPSVWVALAAVILLLIAMLVWSYFGRLPTTILETGVSENGVVTCYMSSVKEIASGMPVKIGSIVGTVQAISDKPYSMREVQKRYNDDYTVHILGVEDWNYQVTIDAPGLEDGLTELVIETGSVRPMTFLFN